jgi:hypothetical protein
VRSSDFSYEVAQNKIPEYAYTRISIAPYCIAHIEHSAQLKGFATTAQPQWSRYVHFHITLQLFLQNLF